MAHTLLSLNEEADRQARTLLKRLDDDGPEQVHSSTMESAKLLERRGFISISAGTMTISSKGKSEIGSRVLR